MKNKILSYFLIFMTAFIYSQNQVLLDESWFIERARNSNVSNFIWDNSTLTFQELRFELVFLNDKIVMVGCCGGIFEMDVNYINNTEIEIINLNEIETTNCNESHVTSFYNAIKGSFISLIGETITFNIQNNPFQPGIKDVVFNHPSNNTFIGFSNSPNEINGQAQAPYWGHEPPIHQWSLTQVLYQGQTMELPYGAALTIADIYEGSFAISMCGEVFVALNSSWYLDVEELMGPCFISCGILENIPGVCEPVAGYDNTYLETFKQNAFNFLNDNINQTMEYEFISGGSPPQNARKLVIYDFSQNKLIFHSNENYLSTLDNNIQTIISIYPNPVKETLHISQNSHQFATAIIYDVRGKKLQQHSLENKTSSIDVKGLNPRLYFLVLEKLTGEYISRKFVIK